MRLNHIKGLISRSAVFPPTKNWSEKSLASLDLRSPVQQVKRTNFALFKILTGDISSERVKLKQHHWGDRRIPIRNLIVLTNSKPNEEFQYVKVLTVNELLGYVRYFKPMFTSAETQAIASYLLNLNDQKHLTQRAWRPKRNLTAANKSIAVRLADTTHFKSSNANQLQFRQTQRY